MASISGGAGANATLHLHVNTAKFTGPIRLAGQQVQHLGRLGASSVAGISTAADNASSSLMQMGRAARIAFQFSLAYGAIRALQETAVKAVTAADSYNRLEARIKDATRTSGDFAQVWDQIAGISIRNGVALEATATLFQRLNMSAADLGKKSEDVLVLTDLVQKLGVIAGASTESMRYGLTQFSQAMSMGRLKAEEFNSIMENIPAVGYEIAKGMNMTAGELRNAVIEGKVLAEDIYLALLSRGDQILERFEQMPMTLGRATAVLDNMFTKFSHDALEAVEGIETLNNATLWLADQLRWDEMSDRVSTYFMSWTNYINDTDTLLEFFAQSSVWDGITSAVEHTMNEVSEAWGKWYDVMQDFPYYADALIKILAAFTVEFYGEVKIWLAEIEELWDNTWHDVSVSLEETWITIRETYIYYRNELENLIKSSLAWIKEQYAGLKGVFADVLESVKGKTAGDSEVLGKWIDGLRQSADATLKNAAALREDTEATTDNLTLKERINQEIVKGTYDRIKEGWAIQDAGKKAVKAAQDAAKADTKAAHEIAAAATKRALAATTARKQQELLNKEMGEAIRQFEALDRAEQIRLIREKTLEAQQEIRIKAEKKTTDAMAELTGAELKHMVALGNRQAALVLYAREKAIIDHQLSKGLWDQDSAAAALAKTWADLEKKLNGGTSASKGVTAATKEAEKALKAYNKEAERAIELVEKENREIFKKSDALVKELASMGEAWAMAVLYHNEEERWLGQLAAGNVSLPVLNRHMAEFAANMEKGTKKTGENADAMTEWEKLSSKALKRIDSAFVDLWKSAFSGFRDFADALKDAFIQLLAELAHAAFTKRIVISIGAALGLSAEALGGTALGGEGGGGGGGGFLSGIANWFGGNSIGKGFESFGSTLGGWFGSDTNIFSGAAGYGNWAYSAAGLIAGLIGNAIFGKEGGIGASLGASVGMAFGPIGAVVGGILGGLVGSLFKSNSDVTPDLVMFNRPNLTDARFPGGNGYTLSEDQQDVAWSYTSGFGGFSGHTRHDPFANAQDAENFGRSMEAFAKVEDAVISLVDEGTARAIREAVAGLSDVDIEEFSGAGPIGKFFRARMETAFDVIGGELDMLYDTFKSDVDFANPQKTAALVAGIAIISSATGDLKTVFDDMLPNVETLRELGNEGELFIETFVRLGAQLVGVNVALEAINVGLLPLNTQGAVLADTLLDLFGGMENFTSAVGLYYDKFFTEEEKAATIMKTATEAWKDLGREMPATREGFRDLVESLDLTTEEGQLLFKALMSLVPLMDEVYTITEQQADEEAKLAEARAKALEETRRLRKEGYERFLEAFAPQGHQDSYLTSQVNDAFRELNLQLPATRDGFYDLVRGLDKSTVEGLALFDALLALVPLLDEYYDMLERNAQVIEDEQMAALETEIDIAKKRAELWVRTAQAAYDTAKAQYDQFMSIYNSIKQNASAFADFERNSMNSRAALQAANAEVWGLVLGFDGTIESATELNTAVQRRYQAEMRFLQEIESSISTIRSTFKSAIDSIREDLIPQEDKFDYFMGRARSLYSTLGSLTDPSAITATAQEISRLVSAAYGSLEEEDRAAMGPSLVAFLEQVQTQAISMLEEAREQARAESEELSSMILSSMEEAAALFAERVAETQEELIEAMQVAADIQKAAGEAMKIAADDIEMASKIIRDAAETIPEVIQVQVSADA